VRILNACKNSIQELKDLQNKLLQKQIQHVYKNSKFYRSKLEKAHISPDNIKTIEDLSKIPFTTREELEKNFQDVLAVQYKNVATIRLTSGTTGNPLKIAHTRKDINAIANVSARRLKYHGINNTDVVQITSAYGLWQGAWSMHWGAEKMGVCILPVGPADSERQILLIKQFGTTVLYGATNYHLRLLEVAKSLGEDLSKFNLKTAFCVAEKPTKNQIATLKKEAGYQKVISDYGATEFPGFSVNCKTNPESHHVWADYYLVEVVDPETREVLKEGEKGELVITSLQREAFPLVRYLSNDLTVLYGYQKCSCGLTHPKISGDIDRKDYMTKIRGVTIYPSHIETLLSKFPQLTGKAQLTVDKRTPKHETVLKLEVKSGFSQSNERDIKEVIIMEIKNRLGITLNEIQLIPQGQLESKYKKVIVIN
jgi:phenylacetate-CoA ligase